MTPRRLILDVVAPRGVPSTARASASARASCVVCAVPRACPHFPACSGCVTALDAVDALDPPVLEAVREYFGDDAHETFRGRATRWRCKAKLAARAETSSGRVALGLFKRGTHELAATDTCPVSHVGVERAADGGAVAVDDVGGVQKLPRAEPRRARLRLQSLAFQSQPWHFPVILRNGSIRNDASIERKRCKGRLEPQRL